MNIEEIIKQIPEWQKAHSISYETLSGGYSNSVYKVFVDHKIYAVRINGTQNKFLGLFYEDEFEIISLAAKENTTPNALKCQNKTDYLITDFVEGSMLTVDQMSDTVLLKKTIEQIKIIHNISYSGKRYSTPFSLTRGYLKGIENLGAKIPNNLKGFLAKMNTIEQKRKNDSDYQKHYCHNDALTHNMLLCKDGNIQLIDWELSGIGDIWFDLASISYSCGFNQTTDKTMLEYYFGNFNDQKLETLHDIKFVCMIRQIGWALLHTALNNKNGHPKSYMNFANSLIERLKQGLVTLV